MISTTTNIAVVQGTDSETAQRLLAETVADWRASGLKVAGVTAQGQGAPDRTCTAGYLRDVGSGQEFRIYLETAPVDTSCDLDASGVEAACASVMDEIAGSDVVVLSKFGKLEAMQQGLSPAFKAAIAAGRPVVTTVSPKHRAAWQAFAPEASYIEADKPALMNWLARETGS